MFGTRTVSAYHPGVGDLPALLQPNPNRTMTNPTKHPITFAMHNLNRAIYILNSLLSEHFAPDPRLSLLAKAEARISEAREANPNLSEAENPLLVLKLMQAQNLADKVREDIRRISPNPSPNA